MSRSPLLLSFLALLALSACNVNFGRSPRTTGTTTARSGDRATTTSRRDRDRNSAATYIRADIVNHAQELLGLKYKFGGNNPSQGFDCSGLVLYLYQNAGVDIERVSREQAKQGENIPISKAKPGDLVFYKRKGKAVHHVSVIVDAGINKLEVIHATSRGVVRENVLESRYWEPLIYQVRDILE